MLKPIVHCGNVLLWPGLPYPPYPHLVTSSVIRTIQITTTQRLINLSCQVNSHQMASTARLLQKQQSANYGGHSFIFGATLQAHSFTQLGLFAIVNMGLQ